MKRGKSGKGGTSKSTKPKSRGTTARKPVAASSPARAVRTAPPPLALIERAEQLRDDIQRSKTAHPDPWSYTTKARAWAQRAQGLVEEINRSGDTPSHRRALESLTAQVEADRDFQQARRLF